MNISLSKPVICMTAAALLAAPQLAVAQSAPSLSDLFACEAITEADDQLACFRRETAKLRNVDAPPAPIAVPQSAAPQPPAPYSLSAPTPPAEPEFAPLKKKEAKAPKSRTLAIRSTSTAANGYVRFTLENGEVWQQIEKERVRLGRGDPDTLTIKRKSFGSFLGTVNGKRPSFRLRRVE